MKRLLALVFGASLAASPFPAAADEADPPATAPAPELVSAYLQHGWAGVLREVARQHRGEVARPPGPAAPPRAELLRALPRSSPLRWFLEAQGPAPADRDARRPQHATR
jgi:hypothetical protein